MNRCEGCPLSCCRDFKITSEINDPFGLSEELKRFPFIKKTGETLVLDPSGRERIVGVYNCDRFDVENQACKNYGVEPRPEFCEITGVKTVPHSKCLLKLNVNEKQAA